VNGSFIVGAVMGITVSWCAFSARRGWRMVGYDLASANVRVAARNVVAIVDCTKECSVRFGVHVHFGR
jgi:hypothetical protein